MKYDMTLKLFGSVYSSFIKKSFSKDTLKAIKKEYKNIMKRASDIGNKNMLISSYSLAAFFIAMNRLDHLSSEENYLILHDGMKKSKLLKITMGDAKSYLSDKRNEKRKKWSIDTKKKIYPNDWVVEIVDSDPSYYEIDYYECGACKLCRDEQCPELTKYLCKLDYLLAGIMGLELHRKKTLANGDNMCDFKYKR